MPPTSRGRSPGSAPSRNDCFSVRCATRTPPARRRRPERLDAAERKQESPPNVHHVTSRICMRCDLAASRDLARSLDQDATREVIQRSTLPREGTWCIVDVVESSGAIHRLAVIHPDPAKQKRVKALADQWFPKPEDPEDILNLVSRAGGKPIAITSDSEAALISAVHGAENLAVLRRFGFGALLVVPLIARDTVLGTITFVTPEGGAPFSADEIALASDLADRCAMALENARLYREADALRASADEANRAKSEFLGKMSHELRTPLNAIGGYVELLELAKESLSAEQRSNLSRIKHNQAHLVTLISQLLSFVRTESGRMEYRFAEIPVQAALNDVGEMLDGLIRDRGLRLDLRPGDASVAVWADADRIRQILMNLVMNAVKYTKAGGGTMPPLSPNSRRDGYARASAFRRMFLCANEEAPNS